MDSGREMRRRQQREELKRTKDAVASGDPVGAIAILEDSSYLRGLTIDMKNKWSSLPGEDAVAEAMQTLYFRIRDGKEVANIAAYLRKGAENGAKKVLDRRRREKSKAEKLEYLYEGSSPSAHQESVFEETEDADEEQEERSRAEARARGVALARSVLLRLGQKNIQAVMSYHIEVVETDPDRVADISNEEYAEATGLTVDAAKQCKSRGFRRLVDIAKEEGWVEEDFDPMDFMPDRDEGEGPGE